MAPQSFRQMAGIPASSVSASSDSTALLVIDAQTSYAQGAPLAISGVEAAQAQIAKLVSVFRKAGRAGQIFWIQHSAGVGAPVFDPERSELFDFMGGDDNLRPKDGETIIVKKAPSCFTGTDLHELLQKQGTKQLVLTGYMAHVCVTGTARSSMEHGYDTVVVRDAIGDRDIPSWKDTAETVRAETLVDTVCTELGDFFATIVKTADVKA